MEPQAVVKPTVIPVQRPQRQLLVLDLDETMVSSHFTPLDDYDFVVHISGQAVWVKGRPGLIDFLREADQLYDLAVFSAAHSSYVHAVVKRLMPPHIYAGLVFIWSGERVTHHHWFDWDRGPCEARVKKLSKIWRQRSNHYTRHNTLILDDYAETYMLNKGNSIPIAEYNGESRDTELIRIMKLLRALHGLRDVRPVEKRHVKTESMPRSSP